MNAVIAVAGMMVGLLVFLSFLVFYDWLFETLWGDDQ